MDIKDFSKSQSFLEIPNLLAIQLESFHSFLQTGIPTEERKDTGLEALFRANFNIDDIRRNYQLEYVRYTIGNPKYSPSEAQEKMVSYTVPLKVTLRLIKKDKDQETIKDVVEEEVYLCELPYMTDSGTFIINGVERVVVSQLHRAPGLYFSREGDEHSALLIPYRGAWTEFVIDKNNVLLVVLDRRRRVNIATFCYAMGYSLENVIQKIFKVEEKSLRPNQIIAKSIYDQDGNLCAEAGELISEHILNYLKSKNIHKAVVISEDEIGVDILIKTFRQEKVLSQEEATKKIYTRLRNMAPHSSEIAKNTILGMLFDKNRFDLGAVGRYKLNRRIERNVSLNRTEFEKEDFFLIIKKLIEFKEKRLISDDIDHLANRRVRRVGELLENQFRNAIMQLVQSIKERASYIELSRATPNDLVNSRIIANAVTKFFTQNQLSQFMEQTNPLTELTHKRRISALGPGGLTKETAGFEVRDVHFSHYGRLCPIETPEGPNIGLIATVATYANIDEFGFITTPYWKVKDGIVTRKIEYLNPEQEGDFYIAQANSPLDEQRRFKAKEIVCRKQGDIVTVSPDKVDYMDVTPKQLFAPSTIMIPFLEHDDADRALMGANMQRQAVPLLQPEKPLVATGVEAKFAIASGTVITAPENGEVVKVDAERILLSTASGLKEFKLKKFNKSNQYTCLSQRPIVKLKEKVKKGDLLADGPATDSGQLALGRNVLVAFIPWYGYNYEDAIVISEDLIKNDTYTSIQILDFEIEARDTKLGA
ncbi:MAG: DNA-directed RNA polymerase subunit beta, partial [candidate division WOR-3 bacterium]